MAGMNSRLRTATSFLLPLLGLVVAAATLSWLFTALALNWYILALLVFLITRVLTDIVAYILAGSRQVFYLDEYIKELLIYTLVALIAVAAVDVARRYIGGEVWLPLLAAAMSLTWLRSC